MSNRTDRTDRTDRPAPQTSPDRPTDRPTATFSTADHLARLEREEAAHLDRLADLWADATPTEELPVVDRPLDRPATPSQREQAAPLPSGQPGHPRVSTRPEPTGGRETPLQDMWRPGILRRPSMTWHPSLMQLAIGAALVLAIIGACNVAAIQAHRTARAHCHALVVSDWERAERECRGTGAGTPLPEQVSPQPARPEQPPAPAQQAPAPAEWTVHGTDSPYDRTDPAASPLDLPRCTADPSTPLPCLATVSADSRHVTVLEEDASLTGLDRR